MDRRRKITLEQRDEILRRRLSGESAVVLAVEFGLSRTTVDEYYQTSLESARHLKRRQRSNLLKKLGLTRVTATEKVPALKTRSPAPKRRMRLSEEKWVTILTRLEAGETLNSLATEFGISASYISIKRKKQKLGPNPLIPMELQHLEWLRTQLMPEGKRRRQLFTKMEVRALLKVKFGQRLSLRNFHSQLRWMGVAGNNKQHERKQLLRQAKRQVLKDEAAIIANAVREKLVTIPVRGRPVDKKT